MKKQVNYLLFLLPLLLSCIDEDIIKPCKPVCETDTVFVDVTDTLVYTNCIEMNISESLPIKLWKNDEQSYSQKSIPGVHTACFAEKFDCDDTLKIFIEDPDKEVIEYDDVFLYYDFDSSLSPFSNNIGSQPAGSEAWVWDSGSGGRAFLDGVSATSESSDDQSYILAREIEDVSLDYWPSGEYQFELLVNNNSYGGSDVLINVVFLDDLGNVITKSSDVYGDRIVTNSIGFPLKTLTFRINDEDGDVHKIGISVQRSGAPVDFGFNFSVVDFNISYTRDPDEIGTQRELRIIDSNNQIAGSIDFNDYVEFTPSEYIQCGDVMRLFVYDSDSPQNLIFYTDYFNLFSLFGNSIGDNLLPDNQFIDNNLDNYWSQEGDGNDWTLLPPLDFIRASDPGTTKILFNNEVLMEGEYVVIMHVRGSDYMNFKIHDEYGNILDQRGITATATTTPYQFFIKLNQQSRVGFSIDVQSTSVYIHEFSCFYFENTSTTTKIEYWNNNNFDSIDYSNNPDLKFTAYIDSQFWKETAEEEFESDELSNNVVNRVYNKIIEKRMLEIGYVPNFMHRKIRRILMHDNIVIDGKKWVKRDEYEQENINRYSLSVASVWLTDKESVTRNVI